MLHKWTQKKTLALQPLESFMSSGHVDPMPYRFTGSSLPH